MNKICIQNTLSSIEFETARIRTMSILAALLLGIIQGITEFIPISSSGHLVLVDELINLDSSFVFDVLLNIGTLAALCWYTRHKLLRVFQEVRSKDFSLIAKLALATAPAATAGVLFTDYFEKLNDEMWVVIVMLILLGAAMVLIKQKPHSASDIKQLSYRSAFIIGMAQILALIPGSSRSGVTIMAALLIGMNRKVSAEWSFLMAIPIVFGASFKTLFSQEGIVFVSDNFLAVFVGNIASFVVGLLAIDFLFKVLKSQNLRIFGYYRIALGSILAVLLFANII